jgi:hypothetical protein
VFHDWPPLLHTPGYVEAELVPANSANAELLGKNEIDEKALIDLWGVVKVSELTVLNLYGFAPASRWEELSVFSDVDPRGSEVSS